MKILVMRHGDAQGVSFFGSDHKRNLSELGKKQVLEATQKIMSQPKENWPEIIITSDATRALNTTHLFQKNCGISDLNVVVEPSFYHANLDIVIKVILKYPSINNFMLVGHNPTWSEIIYFWSSARAYALGTGQFCLLDSGKNPHERQIILRQTNWEVI